MILSCMPVISRGFTGGQLEGSSFDFVFFGEVIVDHCDNLGEEELLEDLEGLVLDRVALFLDVDDVFVHLPQSLAQSRVELVLDGAVVLLGHPCRYDGPLVACVKVALPNSRCNSNSCRSSSSLHCFLLTAIQYYYTLTPINSLPIYLSHRNRPTLSPNTCSSLNLRFNLAY
jgi:hypothetical protein